MRHASRFLPVLLALLASAPGRAQTRSARVVAFAEQTGFNGVVLFADSSGSTVWTFGHEDIDAGVATRAETRFQLGSVSKWMSTLLVFRLADMGLVDLDAPIGTVLPDLPRETAQRVTLHHLVTHTSGVPNGLIAAFRSDPTVLDTPRTQAEAVERFASDRLLFAPGSRFDYSHSNWILVQAVVERATGQPFGALVHEYLAEPLGLTGTGVVTGSAFAGRRLAVAYASVEPAERANDRFQPFLGAAGGVTSSAPDLLAVLDALYSDRLLTPASRARLDAVVTDDEGYASGGRVRTMDLGQGDETVAWHTGSNGPSTARVVRATRSGVTVVTLSNTGADSDDTGALAEALLLGAAAEERASR